MYLKSIEVQGFKSFANKIKFDFHNGITGIVGPNGSGKSNVADAVRWVLGEQRVKQLRGGSMQDVIFSGTENRKPLSYASVAITLDNSDHQLPVDYEEVTVTRKLYRSGESEYLINGAGCRLKDINEMFYDTGIGKEGYSIIGQGQIDKILSGKPEERRELFDEAAGIVKFKRRKNLSVRKLDEERQNLTRVNDILSELEKQIGPLKRQSEVAREYLKKKEELKTYDINMFLLETERIKEQIRDLDSKYQIASDELEEANVRYEEMKTEYEAIEEEVDSIDFSIEKAKSQLNETTLLKQQLEGQINVLKEQINTVRMNDEHYDNRLNTIRVEIETRQAQRAELAREQTSVRARLAEVAKSDAQAKEALVDVQSRIASGTAQIEHSKAEIIELLNNRASTKAKIQHYATTQEQITTRKSELGRLILEVSSEAEKQNEVLAAYEEELQQISGRIHAYTEQISTNEQEIDKLQQELSGKQEQLRIGQTAYHRESSRLESLKNITERYDGYGNSIRRVMSNKDREKGLIGVVADIIKVEKEYEIAVETALGGNIQNIVTDNEETAKRMIAYLKQNKFGRATFLPLTSMHGGGGIRQQEALKEPGVIGLASTLVQVEDRFMGLAEQLLGRTIVVDNIDNGIRLARKYKQSLRLVTLEGELMNPGGSMTGGAFKNSSNLLSRRREIEEFEKTVRMLKKEMDDCEQSVNEIKAKRTACYSAIDEIQQKLRRASVKENTAKMNVEQVQNRQREAKLRCEGYLREQEGLELRLQEILDNEDSIQMELETSEALEKELNNRIGELQESLESDKEKETVQLRHSEEVHLAYASLEQQNAFILENITRIQEETEKFETELKELDINKGNASEEIQEKEDKIQDLRETIENSKELFEEINTEIKSQVAKREELNQKHKAFLGKREELSKHMSELDKECFRLSSRRESYEEASEKQINYMWDEYELTYNHAMELRNENLTDLSYMKRQIQVLKGEIKKLGSVNVNAIDDYKSVSERYEFLKGQHDDLVEAEATLMKIIDELDAAMRKQFEEQFALISKEFDIVFKQLFGGGKGTLELMEDEDILEAGIRIIAQPPGKKLQNMMQLSGGEKALTAISLLFAIQNLKPSPFCLLDEIEAALDDNNVVRFAQYLHKLTRNTQFIVITHRRGTMTSADRLYGITMQEKGVSTLVSVDLLEDELEK
ncbi:chromosome segregation protein SMC [Eubacterium sp. am_0171]|uniref:Chromosome partition protein Smc n=1 Tax=Faecalicatena contorta TaxID=39482 RepID=A0A174AV17_9FIRM|nr:MULTISPECIES: chromosome segregation protein SMC [Clostridia]MSC84680.1 chromosome segregation protein SMC [Eubacterium sp. BIOML-A1]MSD07082.1 chromosome segregation protein SMC [Eubacterium sp. BIOML-A2]RYT16441.1 chromosome segregation protein SMC [Eubacterium sp. am_0171]CUN92631.1 Chromosome partition protein Smc [[Eubacterium] contortum] [Faecalicatena contorta]